MMDTWKSLKHMNKTMPKMVTVGQWQRQNINTMSTKSSLEVRH